MSSSPLVFEDAIHILVGAAESISDPTAPTVTELDSMTDLTDELTVDGWDPGVTQNVATLNKLNATIVSDIGSRGTQPTLQFEEQEGGESDARSFFDTQKKAFVMVVSRYGKPEADSVVDVYPACTASLPIDASSSADTFQTFDINVGTRVPPELGVTVASGS